MTGFDLTAIPGVAECALDAATVAGLPATAPPAPWDCVLDGVVWWTRVGRAAATAAGTARAPAVLAPVVVGGFVHYERTPVGGYNEVFGAVARLNRGRPIATVPFMAVDSPAGLVGGRRNWSLPKCLAAFEGRPAAGPLTARGPGWTVRVEARPFGPAAPLPLRGRLRQPWPGGGSREAELVGRSRIRPALIHVEVDSGADLAGWLRPGRHLGAVLSDTRFRLSAAQ